MARSTFQRWIEQRNLHDSLKPYALRSRSERLLNEFTKQRLAVWLAGAVLGLSFVSFLTTAYGLFDLLNGEASFDLGTGGFVQGVVFTIRFVIAFVSTVGIQLIAVALSVYLGIQLVGLFTVGAVAEDPSPWRVLGKWITNRLAKALSVALLVVVLIPFLTFSILFSFATFHQSLESSDEIEQKAADDLRSTFDNTMAQLPGLLERQLNTFIEELVPRPPSENEPVPDAVLVSGAIATTEVSTESPTSGDTLDPGDEGLEIADLTPRSVTAQLAVFQSSLAESISRIEDIRRTDDTAADIASLQQSIADNESAIAEAQSNIDSLTIDNEADQLRFQWEFGQRLQYDGSTFAAIDDIPDIDGRCNGSSVLETFDFGNWRNSFSRDPLIFYAYLLHISNRHEFDFWSPQNSLHERDATGRYILDSRLDNIIESVLELRSILDTPDSDERSASLARFRDGSESLRNDLGYYLKPGANCDNGLGRRARIIREKYGERTFSLEELRLGIAAKEKENTQYRSQITALRSSFQDGDFSDRVRALNDANRELMAFLKVGESAPTLNLIFRAAELVDVTFQRDVIPRLKSIDTLSCNGQIEIVEAIDANEVRSAYFQAIEGDSNCLNRALEMCTQLSGIMRTVQAAVQHPLFFQCETYNVQDDLQEILKVNHFIRYVRLVSTSQSIDDDGSPLGFDDARNRAVNILRMISRERPSLEPELASDFSKSFESALNSLYEIEDESSPRRSWSRMGRMLDDLWSSLKDDKSARITSSFVGERWALGIAVTIDVMIVVLSMLVVLMYRTPVSIGAARSIPNLDEASFDAAMKAMGREDPAVFSSVLKHTHDTGDASYPLRLLLSDVRNPELRQRARMLMALLSHETKSDRKDGDESFLLSRHAVLHLKTLADQQGVYESIDPMRTT